MRTDTVVQRIQGQPFTRVMVISHTSDERQAKSNLGTYRMMPTACPLGWRNVTSATGYYNPAIRYCEGIGNKLSR